MAIAPSTFDSQQEPPWVNNPEWLRDLQDDSELLEIYLQSGRKVAVETLIRRHAEMVSGVIRRLVSNASDAEDAFQATFLVLLKSAKKIQKRASISSWLYGVAYRTACRIRSKSRSQLRGAVALTEDVVDDASESMDPKAMLARQLELDSLDEELQYLPAHLREPLIEHYLLGKTAMQIADRMAMSLSAVEGRLRRGRRMLRKRLAIRGVGLSVVLAGAAWFQKQACAAQASHWVESLLDSPALVSVDGTIDSSALDSAVARPEISSLVQGEIAMRHIFAGKLLGMVGLSMAAVGGLSYAAYAYQFGGGYPTTTVYSSGNNAGSTVAFDTAPNDQFGGGLGGGGGSGPGPGGSGGPGGGGVGQPGSTGAPGGIVAGSGIGAVGDMGGRGSGSMMGGMGPMSGGGSDSGAGEEDESAARFVTPKGPAPEWLNNGNNERESSERLRSKLLFTFEGKFSNIPVSDALAQISKTFEIPFLTATDVDEENKLQTSITYTGPELPLKDVLRKVLYAADLTFVVRSNRIEIVSRNQEATSTRFYDLSFVLGSANQTNSLLNAIQMQIEPETWTSSGGTSAISVIGSLMIVTSPEETHEKIEIFLAEISKANPENLKARATRKPTMMGGMGGGMGGMGGGGMGGMGGGGGGMFRIYDFSSK